MARSPLLIFGLIAGIVGLGSYFQWPAVTQGWPFLIFLLCPLMHIFMGHDHGGGHNHDGSGHKAGPHSSNTKEKDGASCH